MASTLGLSQHITDDDLSLVNHAFKEVAMEILKGESGVDFELANSLWSSQVKEEFKQTLAAYFGAEARSIATKDVINAWVAKATHDKITSVLSSDPRSSETVLINAIYFKGSWRWPFDKEAVLDEPFYPGRYNDAADCYTVKMMRHDSKNKKMLSYFENSLVQVCELPYGGPEGQFAATIVLPRASDDVTCHNNDGRYKSEIRTSVALTELIQSHLTPATWTEWTQGLRPCEGYITLPKFKLEFERELSDTLRAMGIQRAFTDLAQFNRMATDGAAIDAVIHKTFVEVNEEGTEAAAVTAVRMRALAFMPEAPKPTFEMVCDHPFLFSIRHRPSGLVVFSGCIGKP